MTGRTFAQAVSDGDLYAVMVPGMHAAVHPGSRGPVEAARAAYRTFGHRMAGPITVRRVLPGSTFCFNNLGPAEVVVTL